MAGGEVLMHEQGYDGMAIEAMEYSRSKDAPPVVLARHLNGC